MRAASHFRNRGRLDKRLRVPQVSRFRDLGPLLSCPLGFPRIDGLSFFHESLQPAENTNPSLIMIGRRFWSTGKSFVTNPHHRARSNLLWTAMLQAMDLLGLEFPTHDCLQRAAPTRDPGVNQ